MEHLTKTYWNDKTQVLEDVYFVAHNQFLEVLVNGGIICLIPFLLFFYSIRWANRGAGEPIINYYDYTPDKNLRILRFSEISDEWLDFIAECRSGKTHKYDIVEGPMANDTIWNYVNDYLTGRINRKQFWALAEFKYPTHQISFHTLSALNCLNFVKSEVVYNDR